MNEMDKIKVLADIVEIPSVNDDEVSVAKYIRDLFAKYGIESKILKVKGNRANLVAEIMKVVYEGKTATQAEAQ